MVEDEGRKLEHEEQEEEVEAHGRKLGRRLGVADEATDELRREGDDDDFEAHGRRLV
jgi:hypothetical protein